MNILTGDIGGTHTRLATVEQGAGRFRVVDIARYASPDFDGLLPIIESFLHDHPQVQLQQAAFGVAGPVVNGRCRTTNLPWELSASELSTALGIPHVHLLNDLEALAWGIDTLDDSSLVTLQAGHASNQGNQAVIAAGTGLGQAGLTFDGAQRRPFACEGGHTDFAAQTQRDTGLLQALQSRYGHVSWERTVSGAGLVELFRYLLDSQAATTPGWLDDPQQDTAAAISQRALAGDDALCAEALAWFVELYAREAGNLALKLNATGGIFLGGGIAPRILPALKKNYFLQAFMDKGRMQPLLEAMPVKVICEQHTALYGLARYTGLAKAAT
ncbi:glucokinase [Thiogranum longum]|uniref:Glucokinase n=1 Tax=Thiogranum longum TaxID=1537524 RepID=A0A4R1HKW6_9GAMM|nr:glucokinase [Thiogranum longum]TCK17852.1 glucokinase [Thiogranum longum]